jgi:hypothetical protein
MRSLILKNGEDGVAKDGQGLELSNADESAVAALDFVTGKSGWPSATASPTFIAAADKERNLPDAAAGRGWPDP